MIGKKAIVGVLSVLFSFDLKTEKVSQPAKPLYLDLDSVRISKSLCLNFIEATSLTYKILWCRFEKKSQKNNFRLTMTKKNVIFFLITFLFYGGRVKKVMLFLFFWSTEI